MRRALSLAAALLLLAAPAALAQTPTVTSLGSGYWSSSLSSSGTTATELDITTSVDCPKGSSIAVAVLNGSNVRKLESVQDTAPGTQPGDGAPNVYTNANLGNAGSTLANERMSLSVLSRDVPAGALVKVSITSGNALPYIGAAACVTGLMVSTPDFNGTGARNTSGATANPIYTTNTATQQASEVVFGLWGWNSNTVPGSINLGNTGNSSETFSYVGGSIVTVGAIGYNFAWMYAIQTTANPNLQMSITLGSTQNWLVNLYSYYGGTPAAGHPARLPMMGIGE